MYYTHKKYISLLIIVALFISLPAQAAVIGIDIQIPKNTEKILESVADKIAQSGSAIGDAVSSPQFLEGVRTTIKEGAADIQANLTFAVKTAADTMTDSATKSINAFGVEGQAVAKAFGGEIRESATSISNAMHDVSKKISAFPQSLIAPFKVITVVTLGFLGTALSLVMLKKGIEKSINESQAENKKSFVQQIKSLDKKGLLLTTSSLVMLAASVTVILHSENIVARFGMPTPLR